MWKTNSKVRDPVGLGDQECIAHDDESGGPDAE
jgi:hypothetical protein